MAAQPQWIDLDGLTPYQRTMLRVAEEHDAAEARGDLATIMATLVERPEYLLPGNRRLETAEQVRYFYKIMLAELYPRRVSGSRVCLAVGDAVVIQETQFEAKLSDGSIRAFRNVAVMPFEGDKLLGERVYSNTGLDAVLDDIFGAHWPEGSALSVPAEHE